MSIMGAIRPDGVSGRKVYEPKKGPSLLQRGFGGNKMLYSAL